MALNTQLSNHTVNRQAQTIVDDLADGYLELYSAPQPASADTPIVAQQRLVSLRFASPSAPAPINGVITFNPIAPANALASGIAAFYRCLMNDNVTVVMDGSVGTGTVNMRLNNAQIVAGAKVTLSGFMHTVDKSFSGQ